MREVRPDRNARRRTFPCDACGDREQHQRERRRARDGKRDDVDARKRPGENRPAPLFGSWVHCRPLAPRSDSSSIVDRASVDTRARRCRIPGRGQEEERMKLYYHPVSTTSRPIVLFASEEGIALDYQIVDL